MSLRPAVCLCAAAFVTAVLAAAPSARQATTAASGVYTEAQAARGLAVYQKECTYCHHDDLLGGEDLEVIPPALVAASFEERWYGKSVAEMFRVISETMPWRGKGLTPAQYADVVAYLLKENGYHAGSQELPADPARLEKILITEKR